MPQPCSYLVQRVGWLLALELKQSQLAFARRQEMRAMLEKAVESGLSRSALGYATELAVMLALGTEELLPASLLTDMGLGLPRSFDAKKSSKLKLDLQRFRQEPAALSKDEATLLVPVSSNYKSVDGVLVYYTSSGTQVIVGIQVLVIICFFA